ncbi:MAG: MFS transporter [Phycisphaerae bacterium]
MTAPVLTDQPPQQRLRWYQGLTRYQWWVFIVAASAWFFDCTDQRIFMLARTPALTQLLDQPKTSAIVIDYGTYATAATMVGWAVGGLIFGIMGDRWGRTKTLALSVLIYSVFTGLCGLATGGVSFCIFRFLMGGGIGGAFATAATLVAETMPEHARAFFMGLFSALSLFGNMTGSAVAAWGFQPGGHYFASVYEGGIAGWRLLFFVGALPALLIVFIMTTLKESEQWQAARRTATEKLDRQMGDLKGMFTHSRWRRNTIVAVALATTGIVGVWGVGFWSPELIDDALKNRASPEQIDWVRSIGSLLQDVGGFLGIMTFTVLASHVGRRIGFAAAFVTSFAIITYTFLNLHSEWEAYVLLPLVGYCSIAVMGGLVIYLPELYPTRLRSTGTAFGYNVARFSSAVVMLLGNPIRDALRDSGVANPFRTGMIILSTIYLLGLIFLIWAPETKGKPLPEED